MTEKHRAAANQSKNIEECAQYVIGIIIYKKKQTYNSIIIKHTFNSFMFIHI